MYLLWQKLDVLTKMFSCVLPASSQTNVPVFGLQGVVTSSKKFCTKLWPPLCVIVSVPDSTPHSRWQDDCSGTRGPGLSFTILSNLGVYLQSVSTNPQLQSCFSLATWCRNKMLHETQMCRQMLPVAQCIYRKNKLQKYIFYVYVVGKRLQEKRWMKGEWSEWRDNET